MYHYYHRQNISPFVPDLARILPKFHSEILFSGFIFSSRDFSHIINSSFNWERLSMENWKIAFKGISINFKSKSKIKEISFNGSGKKENSNWEKCPQRFKIMMKAILTSGIKESLQTIYISYCGITAKEGGKTLNELGMKDIAVKG